jgi:chitinase
VFRVSHLAQNADHTNLSALSFLLTSGAADNALAWASLSDGDRTSIKSQYAAAGIKLIVSAFGATDTPASAGADPTAAATTMGNWVKQYNLDGIDVDFEVNTSHLLSLWVFG